MVMFRIHYSEGIVLFRFVIDQFCKMRTIIEAMPGIESLSIFFCDLSGITRLVVMAVTFEIITLSPFICITNLHESKALREGIIIQASSGRLLTLSDFIGVWGF